MRKYIFLVVCVLAAVSLLPGCRRASHNGDIDGYWKVLSIDVTDADGNTTDILPEKGMFIGIQLELFQFYPVVPDYDNTDTAYVSLTGKISYNEGAHTLGVSFRGDPSTATLMKYGIPENPVTFTVERADSEYLVLRTPISVIKCRRW